MKQINTSFDEIGSTTSPTTQKKVATKVAISNRIHELMNQRGLTKQQLAQAIGKSPKAVTRWLSGEHNFTVKTISQLSSFFGEPIIQVIGR